MAAVATRSVEDVKPVLPVSPASSSTMAPNDIKGTPPREIKREQELDRGRRRSRSPGDDGDGEGDGEGENADDYADGENQRANSSNSDGPSRKRKRTRKVLDKKFDCPHEGCGKSYSRAEHLYRHQLNHNPKQIYTCDYPDCNRTFVRLDLSLRHKERHSAKGSSLNRKDSLAQHSPTGERPPGIHAGSMSPEANRPGSGYPGQMRPGQMPYQSPKDHMGSPYGTPVTTTPPTAFTNGGSTNGYIHPEGAYRSGPPQQSPNSVGRPTMQTNVPPYGVLSPVSTQPGFHSQHTNTPQSAVAFGVSQPNFAAPPPMNLGPSNFLNESNQRETEPRYAPTTSGEYTDQPSHQASELMMLDQMQMNQQTLPVFGGDTMLNKSPYVAIPEDFVAFLFNQNSSMDGSPMGQMMSQGGYPQNYTDLNNNYSLPYLGNEGVPTGYFPAAHQQVMAVASIVEQNLPEATISDEKSIEIYELIKDRFHEAGQAPIERAREQIFEGDRTQDDHMLSKRMMQAYIGSYWLHFSDQVPILHKPTFSPDKTPNLLLIAMMTIGAACLDKKTHGSEVTKAGSQLSNFCAWHLRWEIFMDSAFRPPSKLWVFQTLLLLELYEKMFATRELHERAHIHHATTITLMRRGRSLVGKSSVDSPPSSDRAGVNGSRHSSTSGMHTQDEWWNHWITNEATRRAAFAAFVIDSIHATMFGHNTVMVTHEMRLPLPCDESLWKATSGAEVSRLDANLNANGMKPIAFLEGLKRTLSHQPVHTNSFGRTILMAGLLSVTWHMNQRDLQIGVLGNGVTQALGGRDKWKGTLNRAFDTWKDDFDKTLRHDGPVNDPYRINVSRRPDVNVVFESRIVLHHLAHMAMHVDIIDCQIFARAKRLLGRPIGPQDLLSAQRRMKDLWAPSAKARDAAYYALKFLRSVLMPADSPPSVSNNNSEGGYNNPAEPYSARDDVLLNRPWVLYFAALVVWCYGYALEGPCPGASIPSTQTEKVRMMQDYLAKYSGGSSPDELKTQKGINENSAMLMVLRDSFETTRWELLHEGANLLKNCISLNAGHST